MSLVSKARLRRAKWEIDRAIHAAIAAVESDNRAACALRRLVVHARAHSDLLRVRGNDGRAGWRCAQQMLPGLSALAAHHADWLREVEHWRAANVSALEQFGALTRFLLADKSIPAFMTQVWLAEPSAEVQQQRRWFKHMGRVGTIRGADTPFRMTKWMAFLFASSPPHFTVEQALRRARAGVLPQAVQSVYPAGPSRRRRKRSRGWLVNLPSVRYPQATIRGWRHVVRRQQPWQDEHWTLRQIRSYAALREEGRVMSHCVAGYHRPCVRGVTTIWSLRCAGRTGEQRRLTIEVLPRSRFMCEALGLRNRRANREEREILRLWAARERLQLAAWI